MVWCRSGLLARHWARKPVPVKSNVNQDRGEGPATWPPDLLALSCPPASTPSVQGLPPPPAGGRARSARRCMDRHTAMLSPSPQRHRLCRIAPPHCPNDSCRKPSSSGFCRAPSSTGVACSIRTLQTPTETTPCTAFPWPVRHRDSSGSRPLAWHRSRPHCGRIPLCRHWVRFPSHSSPATAPRNPLHTRPESPPRLLADNPNSPIWRSIQGQF